MVPTVPIRRFTLPPSSSQVRIKGIGHMILDQIDDQPALFSYQLVTGLLREEMGFTGVVMTDSLQPAGSCRCKPGPRSPYWPDWTTRRLPGQDPC